MRSRRDKVKEKATLDAKPKQGHHGHAELGGCLRTTTVGLVIGTRPEAIKMAPVARALRARGLDPWILLSGQHPGLSPAEHGLDRYEVTPLACNGQPNPLGHAEMVSETLQRCWGRRAPAFVLVQGDTSSALGGARAAVAGGIGLGHVEAGLRTHDPAQPWPEEDFRTEIDALSDLLFAPTRGNAANLRAEGVSGQVTVTGNPGIDALIARSLRRPFRPFWRRQRPLLLVTCHRRENWGGGIDRVADCLLTLAASGRARVDYVLHPNPKVSEQAFARLGQQRGIRLLPPLASDTMVTAMRRADLLLSDSGGMQEEAAAIGLPMLVLRDKTERPESIDSGNAVLVGTDPGRILHWVDRLRLDPAVRARMARPAFPFGTGDASRRIAQAVLDHLSAAEERVRRIA